VPIQHRIPVRPGKHIEAYIDPTAPQPIQIFVGQLAVSFIKKPAAVMLNEQGRVVRILDRSEDRDLNFPTEIYLLPWRRLPDVRKADCFDVLPELGRRKLADQDWNVPRKPAQS